MNQLQLDSLDANLDRVEKALSDAELAELTNFLLYDCYTEKPSKFVAEFIEEFFGNKEWADNLSDEIKKPQYFFKASRNTQELIRLVRIALLEKSLNRFSKLVPKKPKVVLTKEDKTSLKEILEEHQAMLEYQLEDEDFIRNSVDEEEGEELVASKRKHLEFLEKFGNLKFL